MVSYGALAEGSGVIARQSAVTLLEAVDAAAISFLVGVRRRRHLAWWDLKRGSAARVARVLQHQSEVELGPIAEENSEMRGT